MLGKVTSTLLVLLAVSKLSVGQNSHNISIDIPNVLDMKFVNGTSAIQSINLSTIEEIEDGKKLANAATLQVRTNQDWKVMVSAGFPLFSYFNVSNPVNPNMPSEMLQFKRSGASNYASLSYTTPFEIATGLPGNFTDEGHEINVEYFVNPGFDYPAGLYFINVFYTTSAQ